MGDNADQADRSRRVNVDGLLDIRIDRQHDNWSVEVHGEVDLVTAEALRYELSRLNGDRVLLDLSHLAFMDCAGIGLLVGASRSRSDPESLNVRRGSGQVDRLMRICGLDRLLSAA
jgi:anti-anti-sigma factor